MRRLNRALLLGLLGFIPGPVIGQVVALEVGRPKGVMGRLFDPNSPSYDPLPYSMRVLESLLDPTKAEKFAPLAVLPSAKLKQAGEAVSAACFRIVAEGWVEEDRNVLGSGFLISRKNRLVVTMSRVSDISVESDALIAVAPGGGSRYRIDRIYLPRSTTRRFDVGLSAPSSDPADGKIRTCEPAMAIVHLAEGGAELPRECVLASDGDLSIPNGSTVGSVDFGDHCFYPYAHATRSHAKVSFGSVIESVAYRRDRSVDLIAAPAIRRWVRVKLDSIDCGEEAALFREDGRIIGFDAGWFGRFVGDDVAEFYRADMIRDLLAEHQLGEYKDRPVVVDKARDDETDRARRAVRLVREATRLTSEGSFDAADRSASGAIRLFPNYARAYFRRGEAKLLKCESKWSTLSKDEKRKHLATAESDLIRCIECLKPGLDDGACLLYGYSGTYLSLILGDDVMLKQKRELLDVLLKGREPFQGEMEPPLSRRQMLKEEHEGFPEFAELLALRAYLRELDGDRKGAQADYEKAIAVCPLRARTRFLLANFWNREGRPEKEIPMLIEGARLAKSAHLTGPPDPKAPKLEFARALAEASVGKPKSPPKPPRVADLLGPKGNQYLFLDWAEYPE